MVGRAIHRTMSAMRGAKPASRANRQGMRFSPLRRHNQILSFENGFQPLTLRGLCLGSHTASFN
jgi:hypothetical protein